VVIDEKNSRSECSGKGVGVSKTSVSTIDPLDEPNDTLKKKETIEIINLLANSIFFLFYNNCASDRFYMKE
jgi:hypothetical protein